MSGHTHRHRFQVDGLVAIGARRVGMVARLRAMGVELERSERFTPDAYLFDRLERVLVVYEVVVTHDITSRKLQRLRSLRSRLAGIGWTLVLIAAVCGFLHELDIDTGRMIDEDEVFRRAVESLVMPCR